MGERRLVFLRDRRLLLAVLMISIVAITAALAAFGWTPTWGALGVPALQQPFADTRSLPQWLAILESGRDPRVLHPDSPGFAMNYPIVWMTLARQFRLGVERNLLLFVFTGTAFYIACLVALLWKYPSVWLLVLMLSGSSMLVVERANTDIWLFVLLFLSAVVSNAWVSGGLITAATALKVYPIAAAVALVKKPLVAIVTVLASVALLILDWRGLTLARSPVGWYLSYGSPSLSAAVWRLARTNVNPLVFTVPLLLTALLLARLRAVQHVIALQEPPDQVVRLFLTGASIYVFTFAVSSNSDYRLIFLMLCVPYVSLMADGRVRVLVLSLMVMASNLNRFEWALGYPLGIWGVTVAKTLLFVMLTAVLGNELTTLTGESWVHFRRPRNGRPELSRPWTDLRS